MANGRDELQMSRPLSQFHDDKWDNTGARAGQGKVSQGCANCGYFSHSGGGSGGNRLSLPVKQI